MLEQVYLTLKDKAGHILYFVIVNKFSKKTKSKNPPNNFRPPKPQDHWFPLKT